MKKYSIIYPNVPNCAGIKYEAIFKNTGPLKCIIEINLTIQDNRKCSITIQHTVANLKNQMIQQLPSALHGSVHQLEKIKMVEKLFIVVPLDELSCIFEILHALDPFDDHVLYELEESSGIPFNWSDAKINHLISLYGLEESVNMLKNESIDRCYQTGLFVEKLCRSDPSNESFDNMLIQIQCFSQIPESHPKYNEANQKIYALCHTIHLSSHSKNTQLWFKIELLRCIYKLKKFDEAVILLSDMCQFKDDENIAKLEDLSSVSLINHLIDIIREFHKLKQYPSPRTSPRNINGLFSVPIHSDQAACTASDSCSLSKD